jgi:peptidoglycan-associated lipoprotein
MSKQNLMKTTRLILFASAALFISTIATAQTKATKKADDEFAVGGYIEAARLYKTAETGVKDLTEKGRVFFQIGECYRLSTLFNMSEEWYGKSITAQYYNTNPEVYYNYAIALQEQGKFEEAIAQLNKYLGKGGEKSKANDRIKSCQTAAEKKAARAKLSVENLTDLNSPSFDYCIVAAGKKDEFVFSSARKESTGSATDPITGQDFMDLFVSTKDKKGKWSTPVPLSDMINTTSHEAVAGFTKDFGFMYFTSCKYDSQERFACDIMVSKKSGASAFSVPRSLNIIDRNADDSSRVGHPAMTPDSKFLFFASDMPGGKGGRDIWYMSYDAQNDKWGKPTNLTSVNTKGDEMFPYIAADGTLYFSSNGRGGMGGLDIYKAEKTGDAAFAAPVALEYPINSSSDDFGFILEEGNTDSKFSGYFTSSRPGGKGLDDIYYFKEPPLEFSLVATVYDEKTGTPLADADVTVKGSNGDDYKLKTDGNGGFTLDKTKIKPEATYTVSVQKQDYIGTGDRFSTMKIGVSTNFAREYFLKPVIIGEEYKMPTVLYPYNQAELLVDNTVNSQDSLNFLLDIMLENPKYIVQLEAHTDFRGDDKYNQTLSQRRAETCVKYLISKGIEEGRLKPVGKGEAEPRKLNSPEGGFPAGTILTEAYITALPADKQEAAHLLNRRTVFRIIDTNYVPKK